MRDPAWIPVWLALISLVHLIANGALRAIVWRWERERIASRVVTKINGKIESLRPPERKP